MTKLMSLKKSKLKNLIYLSFNFYRWWARF